MLDKIFTPNLRYSVNYNWSNNIMAGPLGRSAGWSGGPSLSLEVNLKPITDAIWSSTSAPAGAPTTAPAGAQTTAPSGAPYAAGRSANRGAGHDTVSSAGACGHQL